MAPGLVQHQMHRAHQTSTVPTKTAAPNERVIQGASAGQVSAGITRCPSLPAAGSTLGRRKFLVSMGTGGGKFLGLQPGLCQWARRGPQRWPCPLSAPRAGRVLSRSPAACAPRAATAARGTPGSPSPRPRCVRCDLTFSSAARAWRCSDSSNLLFSSLRSPRRQKLLLEEQGGSGSPARRAPAAPCRGSAGLGGLEASRQHRGPRACPPIGSSSPAKEPWGPWRPVLPRVATAPRGRPQGQGPRHSSTPGTANSHRAQTAVAARTPARRHRHPLPPPPPHPRCSRRCQSHPMLRTGTPRAALSPVPGASAPISKAPVIFFQSAAHVMSKQQCGRERQRGDEVPASAR